MKRIITLFTMLIIGFSSAFGLQSLPNMYTFISFGADLQAPYNVKINSDEYKNSLINGQLSNASKYLLTLGYSWITPQNAMYVAYLIWGTEIEAEVAKVEGEPMLYDYGQNNTTGFLISNSIGHNTNQVIKFTLDRMPSYIYGSEFTKVHDITNLSLPPIDLKANGSVTSVAINSTSSKYNVKIQQPKYPYDSYNQVLCVGTGSTLVLSSLQSTESSNVYKVIPLVSTGSYSQYFNSQTQNYFRVFGDNIADIAKTRVIVIRKGNGKFYSEPQEYYEACNSLYNHF